MENKTMNNTKQTIGKYMKIEKEEGLFFNKEECETLLREYIHISEVQKKVEEAKQEMIDAVEKYSGFKDFFFGGDYKNMKGWKARLLSHLSNLKEEE